MEDVLLVSAAITGALVQTAARPLLPTRFLPLASVLLGVSVMGAQALVGEVELTRVPIAGLMVGLAASGGFDLVSKARPKGQESS